MISRHLRPATIALLVAVALACLMPASAAMADQKTHLFILSGQSNMAGLNPNLSFTPTVTKALAPDKAIVVKQAWGGQPIRRWYKKWTPPKGKKTAAGKQAWGDLYDRMMAAVKPAIEASRPDTVTFVWMQGERDARESLAEVYAASFKGMIAQLQADLNRTDINVVIGRISDFDNANKRYPHWTRIRDIHVNLAKTDPRTEWVDTDDLNGKGNGLHYDKPGYVELGKRFAAKALALIAKAPTAGKTTPAAASDGSKPWFFIVAADPQLSGMPIDEKNWTNGIKHINRLRPDFLAVCGDLTFGGNKSQNRVIPLAMKRDDMLAAKYCKIVAGLDKSIVLRNVAGNHDVGQNPSAATIAWYTKHFGKPWYSFANKRSLFIVLESNLLRDASAGADLAEKQMTWLKTTLADAKDKSYAHTIVFMHHPLFDKTADEKDSYGNMPTPRRKELLAMFHAADVNAVFVGHRHRNGYVKDGEMELITTTVAALGRSSKSNPHGVRIVEVYPDRIEQNFHSYETLPEKVTLKDK